VLTNVKSETKIVRFQQFFASCWISHRYAKILCAYKSQLEPS